MSKNLYSIYDTQLKKFVELSNKTNLKATIKSLRNFISRDNDITNLSDNELSSIAKYNLYFQNSTVHIARLSV